MLFTRSHWRVPATRVVSLDLACSCWRLTQDAPGSPAWGQCAVTRDLGLLTLLPQEIHTGLVLCPFIGLGGHLGQPINLIPRSPLLFLTFHIVTGSNTSVPVLRLFLRVDDYPVVHPHYWTWTWFRFGCVTSGDIMIALLSIFTVSSTKTLPFLGLPCVACCLIL